MHFPIETAAAFPSRTVAAFPLTSIVQSPLDSVNGPWASAVAVRPVQQQHQTQVPFLSQLQGTEFWSTTVVNTTFATWIDRTTANNVARYVSKRLAIATPAAPGFGSGDGGRQDASLTGWNASGKRIQGWCHTIHGNLGS